MNNEMTDLEIFNKVRDHLLTQNDQALDANSMCAYRGAGERRCAIGCLIADEAYDPLIEGRTVAKLCIENRLWSGSCRDHALARGLTLSNIPARLSTHRLLIALQSIHDANGSSKWSRLLSDVARDFDGDTYVGG